MRQSRADLEQQLKSCRRELAEAREQQTATSEVLQVISSSPGELAPVFATMLHNAVRTCEGKFGTLYLYEGDGFRAVAMHNAPAAFAEARASVVHPRPDTSLWRAANTKQVAQIADVTTSQGYVERDPFVVTAVALGGYRTVLSVPMLKDNELIGVISIYRQEVRPFTDKQIELVTSFARQAVIAIENVRLLNEIQNKSRQLEMASEHKSQFVANMSHELRTPLNAIIGLTEMMVTNAARFGTEKAQEPLRRVHAAGTHLLGLINQVLDLSKIEAGKLELNPQMVQLAPLIDEVIGTARQLAEQNKNRLALETEENLGALTVDPMRLRQILLDLLSNACKFTKQGDVTLRARKIADGQHWVELAVAESQERAQHFTRMLAEQWRRQLVFDRRFRKPYRACDRGAGDASRVRYFDFQPAVTHLGIFEHFLIVVDRAAGHVGRFEAFDPVLARTQLHDFADDRDQLAPVPDARWHGGVS